MSKKTYLLGYTVDPALEFKLRLEGRHPEYYRRVSEEELGPEAVEVLEAFDFATRGMERPGVVYIPCVTGEWDHIPTNQELAQTITEGRVSLLPHGEGNFGIETVRLFLSRKISFAELRRAAGGK